MTEDEAKKKWCPFSRVYTGYETPVANRNLPTVGDDETALCIGSECMTWRWEDKYSSVAGVICQVGYCGLAGKP